MMRSVKRKKLSKLSSSSFDVEGSSDVVPPSSSTISNSSDASELPNEILCFLLTHLSLRDAVRTSILSHRWRTIWSYLPTFQLDWDNMCEEADKTLETPCLAADCKDKFVRKVNQFFGFFDEDRPHHQLDRSLNLSFCLGQEHANDIDSWVNIALRKIDVQNLSLSLNCKKGCGSQRQNRQLHNHDDKPIFRGDRFQDDHVGAFSLRRLHLDSFILGPKFSSSTYLRSLTCVALFRVRLASSCDIQSVLYASPTLRTLKLRFVGILPKVLHLGSLPLRWFELFDCPGVKTIYLPNNNKLKIFICLSPQFISYDLRGQSNIISMARCMDREGLQYIFSNFPVDHPKVRCLNVISDLNWATCVPPKIAIFYGVRVLDFWFTKRTKFDSVKIISILKACPALVELILWTNGFGGPQSGMLEHIKYASSRLVHVVISGHIGSPQIDLAAFLLKRVCTLRRLDIQKAVFKSRFVYHWLQWDEEKRMKVCDQLQGFSKATIVVH